MDQTIAAPLLAIEVLVIGTCIGMAAFDLVRKYQRNRRNAKAETRHLARWQAVEARARLLASNGRQPSDIESWVAEMNTRFSKVVS